MMRSISTVRSTAIHSASRGIPDTPCHSEMMISIKTHMFADIWVSPLMGDPVVMAAQIGAAESTKRKFRVERAPLNVGAGEFAVVA